MDNDITFESSTDLDALSVEETSESVPYVSFEESGRPDSSLSLYYISILLTVGLISWYVVNIFKVIEKRSRDVQKKS